jgi:hypothetical protein
LHSFFWQAFDNFVAVLSNDRIQLHDRSKLNSVLSGLGQCLSLVAKATNNDDTPNRQVCNLYMIFFRKFLYEIYGTMMRNLLHVLECIILWKPSNSTSAVKTFSHYLQVGGKLSARELLQCITNEDSSGGSEVFCILLLFALWFGM